MTIANRVSRLFQADVHGILDQLEDPASVVRHAVREMEAAVIEDERRNQALEKRHQHLTSIKSDATRALSELASKVELALKAGNDELCRSLVRKRLEEENRLQEVERVTLKVTTAREETSKRVTERREQLQALIKKMEVFIPAEGLFGSANEDEFGTSRLERRARAVTDDDVEIAMLKLKQKSGAVGRSES